MKRESRCRVVSRYIRHKNSTAHFAGKEINPYTKSILNICCLNLNKLMPTLYDGINHGENHYKLDREQMLSRNLAKYVQDEIFYLSNATGPVIYILALPRLIQNCPVCNKPVSEPSWVLEYCARTNFIAKIELQRMKENGLLQQEVFTLDPLELATADSGITFDQFMAEPALLGRFLDTDGVHWNFPFLRRIITSFGGVIDFMQETNQNPVMTTFI